MLLLVSSNLIANAYSPYLDQIRAHYQRPYRCDICHYQTKLTNFGHDFKIYYAYYKDLKKALKQFELIDSDEDGWSNQKELQMGCAPHDPLNFPHLTTFSHSSEGEPRIHLNNCLMHSH